MNVVEMSEEEMIEYIFKSFQDVCEKLEDANIDSEYIDMVLFEMFNLRMSINASRQEFEDILTDAINEPWDYTDLLANTTVH